MIPAMGGPESLSELDLRFDIPAATGKERHAGRGIPAGER